MTFLATSEIFTDHLSLTYSPEDSPQHEYVDFIHDIGGELHTTKKSGQTIYKLPDYGTLSVHETQSFIKLDCTGSSLAYLRAHSLFLDFLSMLSSSPHRVTRLDAATDVDVPYHTIRNSLMGMFPDYRVYGLSRKAQVAKEFLSKNDEGEDTGTYYVGERGKTRQVLRIYDKAQQMLEVKGELHPPRTRFEVELSRHYEATLRDAAEPSSIFYHVMSPTFFEKPTGLPEWSPGGSDFHWHYDRPAKTTYARMVSELDSISNFDRMLDLADELGANGREVLLKQFAQKLDLKKS